MSLDNKDLGFMYLAEKTSPEDNAIHNLSTKSDGDVKFAEFDTCLHTFRCMNRNVRKYWGPNLDQNLKTERITSLLHDNAWYGEQDHPLQIYDNAKLTAERVKTIYMPNRSHKIMRPEVKGDMLTGTIQTASGTEAGRGFYNEIVQGLIPSFSCRSIAGLGSIGGETYVIVKFLVTYDWVLYPSHKDAHRTGETKLVSKMEDLVKESATNGLMLPGNRTKFTEDVMIPLKELIDFTSNHDDNVKIIMESFDLSMNDVLGFDNKLEHMIIKDHDSRLFVNISKGTRDEVHSFLSSF